MQQFVMKLLRDDDGSVYELYNGVLLECRPHTEGERCPSAAGPASAVAAVPPPVLRPASSVTPLSTAETGYYLGCLFTVRCRVDHGTCTGSSILAEGSASRSSLGNSSPLGGDDRLSDPRESVVTPLSARRTTDLEPSRSSSTSKFDLDHDEPAFKPPSLAGSFSSPPTGSSMRHDSSDQEMRTIGSRPRGTGAAPQPTLAAVPTLSLQSLASAPPTTTENFIVWASHTFLQRYLPLVFRRVEVTGGGSLPRQSSTGGVGGSLERAASSAVFGLGDATPGQSPAGHAPPAPLSLPLTELSPYDDEAVFCVRAADVAKIGVETHHVTARDRRICVLTMETRDFGPAPVPHAATGARGAREVSGVSPTLPYRVVRRRFILQNGGVTRLVSALKAIAPQSLTASPRFVDDGCTADRAAAEMPNREPSLSAASPVRLVSPVSSSAPATAESERSKGSGQSGKGWRTHWPVSFFGLRRRESTTVDSGSRTTGNSASFTSPDDAAPRQPSAADAKPACGSADRGLDSSSGSDGSHPTSGHSSFTDLTELEGGSSLIPHIHFPEDSKHRLSDGASSRHLSFHGGKHPAGDAARRFAPLTLEQWNSCFEGSTRTLNYKMFENAREAVYRCGIDSSATAIRLEVWLYFFGVFTPSSTAAEREFLLHQQSTTDYERLTLQWSSMLPEQETHFRAFKERKQAVEKDVTRTDRKLTVFQQDDSPHLQLLQRVLMAHVLYNFDLGYCQGMSDAASMVVVLVHDSTLFARAAGSATGTSKETKRAPQREERGGSDGSASDEDGGGSETGSSSLGAPHKVSKAAAAQTSFPLQALSRRARQREAAAFTCFRALIATQMAQNFSMDPLHGLPALMRQVRVLLRHFAPDVFTHLKNCQADDVTFTFRWLLMCFKREFTHMSEAMRLWDTVFGCPFTRHFEVVIAVALLVRMGTQIMTALHSCDVVLKFANNLCGNVSVEDLLRCALTFYDDVLVKEVSRLESLAQGAYVPPRTPTVEETVKLCVTVDGDIEGK